MQGVSTIAVGTAATASAHIRRRYPREGQAVDSRKHVCDLGLAAARGGGGARRGQLAAAAGARDRRSGGTGAAGGHGGPARQRELRGSTARA